MADRQCDVFAEPSQKISKKVANVKWGLNECWVPSDEAIRLTSHSGRRARQNARMWVRQIYLGEEDFLCDYLGTVEAVLPQLGGWQKRRPPPVIRDASHGRFPSILWIRLRLRKASHGDS
jgi:hypothetical protein